MNESTLSLVPNVKIAVNAIVASERIPSPPEIDISPGSEIGDGFASKTLAISIKGNEKTVDLFVKYFPEDTNAKAQAFKIAFNTEFRFYDEIFPEMLNFQREKGLEKEEVFDNVPKHFKTGIKYDGIPPIVLENLRKSGYTLRNLREPIDDDHMRLALRAFAKYHAISYAMKDQKPGLFKQFAADTKDFFEIGLNEFGIVDSLGSMMDAFVENLDPVTDRKLLNNCKNLREVLTGHIFAVAKYVDDYAVICLGDCWSNNMMFQYDETTGTPINIKLIDWQAQRYNSPVLDVAYFFYTVATEDILKQFDEYLKLYYDTLADHVRKLGSDSRKVYPRVVFLNHWKKFSKFGLTMSFGAIRMRTMTKEELPNIIDHAEPLVMTSSFDGESSYYAQMKILVQHFIDRGFL